MDSIVQPSVPFLASPREIPDMVYKYIVIAELPVNLSVKLDEDTARIFCVCKRVHEEATEVFYKANSFFIPQTFFRFGKPLQRVPRAALLCGLSATRLGMITKLDVEIPVVHLSTRAKDRKVMAKVKTFVKILAAYSRPELRLRFVGHVGLNRETKELVKTYAGLADIGVSVAHLDMQAIRDAAMTDHSSCLQLMPSALRIIREYSGPVQSLVFIVVHPLLLCQAKLALISHNISSYLLQGHLDPPRVLWNTVPDVLETFGIPEESGTTAQGVWVECFLECPLHCLKTENAWMWRFLPRSHRSLLACASASVV